MQSRWCLLMMMKESFTMPLIPILYIYVSMILHPERTESLDQELISWIVISNLNPIHRNMEMRVLMIHRNMVGFLYRNKRNYTERDSSTIRISESINLDLLLQSPLRVITW